MPRAPETFTKSEKKDYRQAAWQNILSGAASGAATGAGIGTASGGPAGTIPGAIIGGLVGGGLGLMKGANIRRDMRETEIEEIAAEQAIAVAATQSTRTQQASTAAAQKAVKRAGPKDPLAGQNLDVLAGNMPSPGNSPSSGTGYDFIRSEYGWG